MSWDAGAVGLVTKMCFAMEIQVLGKLILGEIDEPQGDGKEARAEKA